jgi:hypothetical protein
MLLDALVYGGRQTGITPPPPGCEPVATVVPKDPGLGATTGARCEEPGALPVAQEWKHLGHVTTQDGATRRPNTVPCVAEKPDVSFSGPLTIFVFSSGPIRPEVSIDEPGIKAACVP